MKVPRKHISLTLRFILGVTAITLVSLAVFVLVMNPPISDLSKMALFLLITAIISSTIGYAAYRFGWMVKGSTLRWTLLVSYLISSILTFFNVWLTARLMFINQHDLLLAMVLLVFAGGMAMVLGYFLSSTITDRIFVLQNAANHLAEGNLDARVEVSGRDEVAQLSENFNRMAAQLQEAKQMRADLIAWVGHDLQTPLTSIQAILEALSDGVVKDPETVQRYLVNAQREVRSLSILIDDLFQVAKLDAGGLTLSRAPNSLSDLISDTLESFSQVARKHEIRLTGEVEKRIDPVDMDAQYIGRVINNLVSNALRFTPAGGSVTISARREGPHVEVRVRDTGEGIPPQDLPYIFDSFYRGEKSRSRATGGAGLGLAIARGIVLAHGGDIQVESTPGEGTEFFFRI
ncbi:MAG TPA: HAMP domain-containing sensor histidine kinase [Anaerolineales bacterium]|jgi:signal transduction histidine kinase|nr:HAMP domain-containing sensor histidine kinase [Anaerolineales bacterium]